MRNIMKLAIIFILLGISTIANAQSEIAKPEIKSISAPQRVLFVGNSFSYFNNGLHNQVANLVRTAGEWQKGKNQFRLKTISGGKLWEHIEGLPPLLDRPQNKQWDVVVLQEFSNGPIKNGAKKAFSDAVDTLTTMVRKSGAQPVLFMTWAYKDNDKMTSQLAKAYIDKANQINALVVPVGLAFEKVARQHPSIELYSPDVFGITDNGEIRYKSVYKHPSVAGTYLAACVFYASLMGKSPEGIPYTAGLPSETGQILQRQAWKTVQNFYHETP